MTETCPVPTAAERRYGEIQDRHKAAMVRTVYAAIDTAARQAKAEMEAAGLAMPPPSFAFLAATLHQHLFCTLCEADPETFAGGRADVAQVIIRNSQNIARHYWGAEGDPAAR